MPKNSRRKKAVRQQAVRKGERYMRAWRSTSAPLPRGNQEPPTAAGLEVDYPAIGFEPIHRIQRLVQARGWVVVEDSHLDGRGMARSTEIMWDYAPAFGGVEFDEEDVDEDVLPMKPNCRFRWDSPFDDGWIVIETAGNWEGCEQHRIIHHKLRFTEAGIAELPGLLDRVESPARGMDAERLTECLANGPCADLVRQREERRIAAGEPEWPD